MNKIKNFTFSHYTFMGFYNASEWKTAWDLEKSLSMVTTSLTILLLLKKGHAKFIKDQATCRNPFIILPKQFSKLIRAEMHQFSQIPCPIWYCLKFYPSSAKNYFPIPTSHQTERNLDLPLTLDMLILSFPEIVLENSRNIFILKH